MARVLKARRQPTLDNSAPGDPKTLFCAPILYKEHAEGKPAPAPFEQLGEVMRTIVRPGRKGTSARTRFTRSQRVNGTAAICAFETWGDVSCRREADIGSLRSAGAFSVSPRNADKSRRCSSCPGWRRKNRTAAPFCLDENQPLRAAAHVFAVAEIPPPMITQVEGNIFTPTSIPSGAVQRDRNQA